MREECDFSNAELVIPPKDPNKTRICIRLDTKVLNWFRQRVREAGGGNYQTMINNVLKEYIARHDIKAEMMLTGLAETTTILSGSITLSTKIKPSAHLDMAYYEYSMRISGASEAPKKDNDEKKEFSLAA